ncbi:methyl-accepting chemotaxis protein [Klenkia marina]|uniref:methyl-accepting chemotaxis protein n=1 Tax=Klenkia marina TaxID=1960309 RepID=UPI001FB470AE|nr:methyl-accepting chemotaxis protein [Klenkia marina]
MRNPVNTWSVPVRLGVGFGTAALALGTIGLSSAVMFGHVGTTTVQSNHTRELASLAAEAKYAAADWNGWQTAYALDANLGRDLASSDSSHQHFVDAADTLDGLLGRLAAADGLTADETAQVASAQAAFADFMDTDQRVYAAYQLGTPEGVEQANGLVLGEEIQHYSAVAAATASVAGSIDARSASTVAAAADTGRAVAITVALVAFVVLAVVGVVVTRSITRPLTRVVQALEAVAGGDLTTRVPYTSGGELGRLESSLNESAAAVGSVIATVATSADAVAASSEELSASAAQISASSEETSVQSTVVSGAADEVSRSVATVAAGAEEMSASIREIAQNANEAARVAADAVSEAEATNQTIQKLGLSSKEIGDVVKVITSIAEQTNLLALNATIEAARAGEAGKGFAVVANEVKELAQETARATEDIARRVEAIQADTTGAVEAIGRIGTVIGQINDYQLTIASAVEEQTATTNEMSRSVAEAAGGTTEIAANITGVSGAADATTQALSQTRVAVDELSRMATDLRTTVGRFTC